MMGWGRGQGGRGVGKGVRGGRCMAAALIRPFPRPVPHPGRRVRYSCVKERKTGAKNKTQTTTERQAGLSHLFLFFLLEDVSLCGLMGLGCSAGLPARPPKTTALSCVLQKRHASLLFSLYCFNYSLFSLFSLPLPLRAVLCCVSLVRRGGKQDDAPHPKNQPDPKTPQKKRCLSFYLSTGAHTQPANQPSARVLCWI